MDRTKCFNDHNTQDHKKCAECRINNRYKRERTR